MPEAVFWVDRDARLRRIQIDPGGHGLATVDLLLDQTDVPAISPADVLGGPANDPRDLTESEVDRLASLRSDNASRGARVDVALPVDDDAVIRARGHLNWQTATVYLAVDAPGKDEDGLLYILPAGAATLKMPVDGMPPETPPQEGWTTQRWDERIDAGETGDLDTLLYKLLVMANLQPDSAEDVAETSRWLREDTLNGTVVDVMEFPTAGDPETEPGEAPFRYWIGRDDGHLDRIELRTAGLGMAHLDLETIEPPTLNIPYGVVGSLST